MMLKSIKWALDEEQEVTDEEIRLRVNPLKSNLNEEADNQQQEDNDNQQQETDDEKEADNQTRIISELTILVTRIRGHDTLITCSVDETKVYTNIIALRKTNLHLIRSGNLFAKFFIFFPFDMLICVGIQPLDDFMNKDFVFFLSKPFSHRIRCEAAEVLSSFFENILFFKLSTLISIAQVLERTNSSKDRSIYLPLLRFFDAVLAEKENVEEFEDLLDAVFNSIENILTNLEASSSLELSMVILSLMNTIITKYLSLLPSAEIPLRIYEKFLFSSDDDAILLGSLVGILEVWLHVFDGQQEYKPCSFFCSLWLTEEYCIVFIVYFRYVTAVYGFWQFWVC
jgi:hypothetical protein